MVIVEDFISHSTFGHENAAFEVNKLAVFAERGRRVLIHGLELGVFLVGLKKNAHLSKFIATVHISLVFYMELLRIFCTMLCP